MLRGAIAPPAASLEMIEMERVEADLLVIDLLSHRPAPEYIVGRVAGIDITKKGD